MGLECKRINKWREEKCRKEKTTKEEEKIEQGEILIKRQTQTLRPKSRGDGWVEGMAG